MLRRDGKESCDDTAVLATATMAEALRPTFSQGTVTLRQFVNWSAISMLGISMKLGESVVSEGQLSSKLGLASKNSPFLTKQNMKLIHTTYDFLLYNCLENEANVFSRQSVVQWACPVCGGQEESGEDPWVKAGGTWWCAPGTRA